MSDEREYVIPYRAIAQSSQVVDTVVDDVYRKAIDPNTLYWPKELGAIIERMRAAEAANDTFFRNAEAWETKCNAAWRERDQMEADCREAADRANLWETRTGLAEAALAEARWERDKLWKALATSCNDARNEINVNGSQLGCERAKTAEARCEELNALKLQAFAISMDANDRAERAEARIAGLEAGLKRIADEDYEPIEESFTRAAAAIARALLAERDE